MYKPRQFSLNRTVKFRRINIPVQFIYKETDIKVEENIPRDAFTSDSELADIQRNKAFVKEALPHFSILHNFAYKMLKNQQDSEDMTQETFLRAIRFFNSYKKGTNCKAWLFKIMKNLIINKFKKDKREAETFNYDDIHNIISNLKSNQFDIDDVQQIIFSKLLDDEMTIALNCLRDDFKMVVILCDLEGLSYEEIAEFLHCPIGTIRSRLHRARRILHQKLFFYAKQRGYNVNTIN